MRYRGTACAVACEHIGGGADADVVGYECDFPAAYIIQHDENEAFQLLLHNAAVDSDVDSDIDNVTVDARRNEKL